MNIQKLPLAERIQRCRDGGTAYPEYIPSIIRGLGEMPVMDYLACLPKQQQRRFADLSGAWYRDCTYQQAALYIEKLTVPAWAGEAMRILAEPMIRYNDLSNQEKPPHPAPAMPPAPRSRRSPPGEKLPLAERLRRAAGREGETPWLHVYRLYVDSFFYNLDNLTGGHAYADTLDVVLAPWLEEYEDMPLLTRFVADSRKLLAADQVQLLYQVLVRPFAEIQKEKERIERECTSLPF